MKVREQIPAAGKAWPRGRAIELRFEGAEPTEPKAKPKRVAVPALAGGTLASAEATKLLVPLLCVPPLPPPVAAALPPAPLAPPPPPLAPDAFALEEVEVW